MALGKSTEPPGTPPPASDLLARKGRATARGFGGAATFDAVSAEVARPISPRTSIELGGAAARRGPVAERRVRPVRVLVADGDALSRKLYRDILETDGHDVVVAADGVEALEAMRDRMPDIAVVNLRLAEPSGLEVARWLDDEARRCAHSAVPVVAMSERFKPGDETAARAGGCAAYLAKPVSIRTFLDTIDRLIPTNR